MKKILLSLAIVLAFVGSAYAADQTATVYADGVIGKSGIAGRVKYVVFTCNSELDAIAATSSRNAKPCYAVLRNGVNVSKAPILHFQGSITQPTLITDLYKVSVQGIATKTGVVFSSGIYYDEVTGSTAAFIVYEQ